MPDPTPFQRSLPNLLTVARVLLAAAMFVALALWPGPPRPRPDGLLLLAAALFLAGAATDTLDGMLARRWRVVSVFGRIMDPFADKVLVVGAFVFLAGPAFSLAPDGGGGRVQLTGVQPWMAVVILARELLVTSIRAVAESSGVDFSAAAAGKWKMILQSLAVPAILLILALAGPVAAGPARAAILAIAWAALAVTAWSALPYAARARQLLAPRAPGA